MKHDRIVLQQFLRDSAAVYAYPYEKAIRMLKGEPTMGIEHRLQNLGTKVISRNRSHAPNPHRHRR